MGPQRSVLKRVDVEQEQSALSHYARDLSEDGASDAVGEHVQGDVGHNGVKPAVRDGKWEGDVGDKESDARTEPDSCPRDSLSRHVDCRDRVAFAGETGRVVPRPAAQLKDGMCLRLSQRAKERRGPKPFPIQIVPACAELTEVVIPEPGAG